MEILRARKIQNQVKSLEDLKNKPFDLITAPTVFNILKQEHDNKSYPASTYNMIKDVAKLLHEDMIEHALYYLGEKLKQEKINSLFQSYDDVKVFKDTYKRDNNLKTLTSRVIVNDIYPTLADESDNFLENYQESRKRKREESEVKDEEEPANKKAKTDE